MTDCTNSVWMKRTVLSEHNIAATELLEKKGRWTQGQEFGLYTRACINAMKYKFVTLRSCYFNKLEVLWNRGVI